MPKVASLGALLTPIMNICHRWAPLSLARSLARFFPQAYRCDPPSSSRDDKAAALGASRAHHALAHDGPPDDPTNQSSAMSALAASAAYAAPGAARALRRCAARARRELPAPRSPQKSLPGFLFRPTRGGARVPSRSRPLPRPDPPARASAASRRVPRARRARPRRPRPLPRRARRPERPPEAASSGWWSLASHAAQHHARWWRGAPGAALPARRSRRPLRRGSPRGRARVARSPIASRTRASSPRGRAEPRRAGAEERSDRTPRLLRVLASVRASSSLGRTTFFTCFFSLFVQNLTPFNPPPRPPPVGPRRESSALRSPSASPR